MFSGDIPKSAIKRIARGAGGHRSLQRGAVEALPQRLTKRLDRRDDPFRAFAVTRIRHAFAAAPVAGVAQLDGHNNSFGLAAAADGEGVGERPALDLCGKLHARSKYDERRAVLKIKAGSLSRDFGIHVQRQFRLFLR